MEPLIYPVENNGTFYCLLEMKLIDVEVFTMHNALGVQTGLRLPMNHLGQKAATVKKKRQHTNLIRSSFERRSNSINHEGMVMVSVECRHSPRHVSRRRSAFITLTLVITVFYVVRLVYTSHISNISWGHSVAIALCSQSSLPVFP